MSRHRPLPSLADLATVSVREVVNTAVARLQNFTEGYVSHYFNSRPAHMRRRQTVKYIQDYILCVPYMFQVMSGSTSRPLIRLGKSLDSVHRQGQGAGVFHIQT